MILGSGDSDYQALVDRARLQGRRIVLCAFSQSVSRDMLATAPLFPLEAELGIQLAKHGDVEAPVAAVPEVENNPDWPTAAVRLVRTSETVRMALGFSDGPISNPVLTR